jgi:myo-inositol 2-dehydrogenase/D-chiro-inositol 1-dehydrogenase
MSQMTTGVNVRLIDAGQMGRLHAESLTFCSLKANLVAAADPQVTFNNDIIDAAITFSRADARFISTAVRTGKHFLWEKSIAVDFAVIDQVPKAVDKSGVKLQLGFNRRFPTCYWH